ncbi:MAG: universal stress protein [Deltaproteobacteria bacterium]|nr:universal stress protein [Deltaproteobacteria bacterium]
MFKNILIPTNFKDKDLLGIDIALGMDLPEDFTITLVHVIEMLADTEDEEFQDFYAKLEKRASKEMGKILDLYEEKKPDISTVILFGHRVREIIRYTHENEIDLIIASSHQIEARDVSQGWMTLSYKIAFLSPCPVLMVK